MGIGIKCQHLFLRSIRIFTEIHFFFVSKLILKKAFYFIIGKNIDNFDLFSKKLFLIFFVLKTEPLLNSDAESI